MEDKHIDAKFGPIPPCPPGLVTTHSTTIMATLVAQSIACFAILVAVHPPFVLSYESQLPTLSMVRVLGAVALAGVATMVLHSCGAQPLDTFTRSSQILYRTFKPV